MEPGGISVTHNEFRVAREKKIPVFAMVDREVESFRRVHESNLDHSAEVGYPGMQDADRVFSFVKEIADSPNNNAILPYSNVGDARNHLKRQLAHLFGDLLRKEFDPLRSDVKDVLTEIKALRHELTTTNTSSNSSNVDERRVFIRATRFLLEDNNKLYGQVLERQCKDLAVSIQLHLTSNSFDELADKVGFRITIDDSLVASVPPSPSEANLTWMQIGMPDRYIASHPNSRYVLAGDKAGGLVINSVGKAMLDNFFTRLKKEIE